MLKQSERNDISEVTLTHPIGGTNREGEFKYLTGERISVENASNLPEDSEIHFWVTGDYWEDDPVGLPVYFDQYSDPS